MATLKEPPEAVFKPPPKSKWSAAPAAPKCPACRKGSDKTNGIRYKDERKRKNENLKTS